MQRAVACICTAANTHRRIAEGIRYESRLEEIESILNHIPVEAIAEAKNKMLVETGR